MKFALAMSISLPSVEACPLGDTFGGKRHGRRRAASPVSEMGEGVHGRFGPFLFGQRQGRPFAILENDLSGGATYAKKASGFIVGEFVERIRRCPLTSPLLRDDGDATPTVSGADKVMRGLRIWKAIQFNSCPDVDEAVLAQFERLYRAGYRDGPTRRRLRSLFARFYAVPAWGDAFVRNGQIAIDDDEGAEDRWIPPLPLSAVEIGALGRFGDFKFDLDEQTLLPYAWTDDWRKDVRRGTGVARLLGGLVHTQGLQEWLSGLQDDSGEEACVFAGAVSFWHSHSMTPSDAVDRAVVDLVSTALRCVRDDYGASVAACAHLIDSYAGARWGTSMTLAMSQLAAGLGDDTRHAMDESSSTYLPPTRDDSPFAHAHALLDEFDDARSGVDQDSTSNEIIGRDAYGLTFSDLIDKMYPQAAKSDPDASNESAVRDVLTRTWRVCADIASSDRASGFSFYSREAVHVALGLLADLSAVFVCPVLERASNEPCDPYGFAETIREDLVCRIVVASSGVADIDRDVVSARAPFSDVGDAVTPLAAALAAQPEPEEAGEGDADDMSIEEVPNPLDASDHDPDFDFAEDDSYDDLDEDEDGEHYDYEDGEVYHDDDDDSDDDEDFSDDRTDEYSGGDGACQSHGGSQSSSEQTVVRAGGNNAACNHAREGPKPWVDALTNAFALLTLAASVTALATS